jgi:hypothetical protein
LEVIWARPVKSKNQDQLILREIEYTGGRRRITE